ncbi:ABC transporter permease [Arthrobacter sp. BF1]|uniref:ABC transporter permease n=1 Tax=Arthrobacter sp. BF1 TaxID=2821145 RepID=UPI001C4FCD0F|nr:ABC transporter permease [Arthrobacter sp. BF1]
MFAFLAKRTLALVATVLLASFAVFLIPYATPGDPARKIIRSRVAGDAIDESAISSLTTELGLHDPLFVQFHRWLGRFLSGDMGLSYSSQTPVVEQVLPALGITLTLVVAALGVAVLVSLILGITSGLHEGRRTDRVITTVTQALIAIPEYWLAPMLVLIFAVKLTLLPSAGWVSGASLVLPVAVLAARPSSYFTSAVRSGMIEALDAEHVTAARSRGLSYPRTIMRHVIPNGLLPLATLLAVWFAGLLGGSVIVEVIFSIPGMGRLLYDAVLNNDIPVAQGSVVLLVALAVAITTMADLVHRTLNPLLGDNRA